MSHLSKVFNEAPIKVQNRNGFDLSHVHAGTSKCGQLVPVLTKLLTPNSTISLGVNAEVSLPPLVAPFYGKVDFAIEGFIVPCSILYGGWKQFISNQESTQFTANQAAVRSDGSNQISGAVTGGVDSNISNALSTGYALPKFDFYNIYRNDIGSFKTLAQSNENIYAYMGANLEGVDTGSFDPLYISLMPAVAYHRICDVFYRNTKLTKTWFAVNPNVGFPATSNLSVAAFEQLSSSYNQKNVSLIWHSFYTNSTIGSSGGIVGNDSSSVFDSADTLTFPDGTSIFSTRQRQYTRDYFTSAVPSPQQGQAASISFDTSGSDGEFTYAALTQMTALARFLATNNLSGDYSEMMRNRWGVRPIDADFEEPHYLGRVVVPVYQHTIYKQDAAAAYDGDGTTNPFVSNGLLGAKAASAGANAEGSICNNFNVSCWSYLMVIASLVPHANYNYGINRELTMTTLGDFPAPELQGVGMEEIKQYEISNMGASTSQDTWGYIPRYSRFKYIDDHVSGELAPGNTLEQFQLQRQFNDTPTLSTDFVEIAKTDLDGVLAVNTATMDLTCWWEIFFNLKVVMPLSDFIIPTLASELVDTHTQKTSVGGSRL